MRSSARSSAELDHDGLEVPGQADRVDDFGHLGGEFLLGTVVPVRLLDGASLIETEGTSRLVRPLLSRLRIVRRLDHALDLEVGEHVVAVVLQEKGLSAVADQNHAVMGIFNALFTMVLLLSRSFLPIRRRTL